MLELGREWGMYVVSFLKIKSPYMVEALLITVLIKSLYLLWLKFFTFDLFYIKSLL